jgi:hypothetical protein
MPQSEPAYKLNSRVRILPNVFEETNGKLGTIIEYKYEEDVFGEHEEETGLWMYMVEFDDVYIDEEGGEVYELWFLREEIESLSPQVVTPSGFARFVRNNDG